MIFKYSQLKVFLKKIREKGPTLLFKGLQEENSGFLLRHDIDFDLFYAEKMAKLEAEEGVKSTFFILTSCRTYNVLSPSNRKHIQTISKLGHEIGLHFDPQLYTSDLESYCKKEADILSEICGKQVRSVSLHNPSVHGQYPMFKDFVNAYDKKYFSPENYLADSRMSFRGKDPFNFLDQENSLLQILLHPLHYSEEGYGYDKIMWESFKRLMSETYKEFCMNDQCAKDIHYEDYLDSVKQQLGFPMKEE
ncbi:MAG: hypothetical protein GY915_09640 [bacterium]|nr:hypothetical protein [bacterium]